MKSTTTTRKPRAKRVPITPFPAVTAERNAYAERIGAGCFRTLSAPRAE